MSDPRITRLMAAHAELGPLLGELRRAGPIRWPQQHRFPATASDDELSEFLLLAVPQLSEEAARNLAFELPGLLHRRGAGAEALRPCLDRAGMAPDQLVRTFSALVEDESLDLVDRHRTAEAAARIGLTGVYANLLWVRADALAAAAPGELGRYLLGPDTRPDPHVVDALVSAIRCSPDPEPFVRRCQEWFEDGSFDSEPGHGAGELYQRLEENADDVRFGPVRQAAIEHLVTVLRDPDRTREAWHRLRDLASVRGSTLPAGFCERLAEARVPATPYQRAALRPWLHLVRDVAARSTIRFQDEWLRVDAAGPPGERPADDASGPPEDPAGYLVPSASASPATRSGLRGLFGGSALTRRERGARSVPHPP